MTGLLRAEFPDVHASGGPLVASLSADEGSALNSVVAHPTQRRLLIALAVTLACLPLLVLDLLSGSSSSSATELAVASSDSSLVASTQTVVDAPVDPSSVEIDTPDAVVPETTSTTVAIATTTTTAARRVQQTTTTTAPRPVVTAPPMAQSDADFLACVRIRESHGDYTASDPTGTFLGAYQIYQGGWDAIAGAIGRADLVGVPPHHASPTDQDTIAAAMLARYGRSPWGGSCR